MIFFGKCSEVKVKVVRNRSSKVKYKYKKILLKYSNEVFLLRYYTTLVGYLHETLQGLHPAGQMIAYGPYSTDEFRPF